MHIVEDRITNLQKELMKIFSLELTEEELSEVRNMLAKYFAAGPHQKWINFGKSGAIHRKQLMNG